MGGFVHPLLAFGAFAAAVPLIIHLLNRRRHQPMPWAAMRFARAAWKRIRRRTRFENLLLLLLRMAAVALFALAIARPFTGAGSLLSGLANQHRELVVILDGSASMGHRADLTSLWDTALETTRKAIDEVAGNENNRVHLYLVGDRPRRLSERAPSQALSMLASLEEPLAEGFNLEAALGRIASDLDEAGLGTEDSGSVEFLLISDLQRISFIGKDGAQAADALADFETRGWQLHVVDAAAGLARKPENLSVISLVALDPFGEPIRPGRGAAPTLKNPSLAHFAAVVHNSAAQGRDVNVALVIDGQRRPSTRLFIEAGAKAEVELEASLTATGENQTGAFRTVEVVIEADALSIDDSRSLVVSAPGSLGVLLINGAPSADFESDEIAYLRAAFDPLGGSGTSEQSPFDVAVMSPKEAATSVDLARFGFIWLANTEEPSEDLVAALKQRVQAGATLVVSVGDHVVPELYNQRLGAAGLLPVKLLERRGDPSRRGGHMRARIDANDHEALTFFRDERFAVFFTEVPVFEFIDSELLPEARLLASLDNRVTGGSPLLVESFEGTGAGRILFWSTSIDGDWTLFPESPTSLIPLVHELAFGSAIAPGPLRNRLVGDPLEADFESFPETPTLQAPSGSVQAIDEVAVEDSNGRRWQLTARRAAQEPGIWRVSTNLAEVAFAVTMSPIEGNLERLSQDQLASLSPVYQFSNADQVGGNSSSEDSELFRALLIAALLCLIGEALWTRHLSRERAL